VGSARNPLPPLMQLMPDVILKSISDSREP
jgi:hypothetical protein